MNGNKHRRKVQRTVVSLKMQLGRVRLKRVAAGANVFCFLQFQTWEMWLLMIKHVPQGFREEGRGFQVVTQQILLELNHLCSLDSSPTDFGF